MKNGIVVWALLCIAFTSMAQHSTGPYEPPQYPYDDLPVLYNAEAFTEHALDLNNDGIIDKLLQPNTPKGMFMVLYGKHQEQQTVYHNKDAVTFSALSDDETIDWSSEHVDLLLGQFNSSPEIDLLAFSKTSSAMYLVDGVQGHFLINHAQPVAADNLIPFSASSQHYVLRAARLNDDNYTDIIAISTEKRVDGQRLNHFVVQLGAPDETAHPLNVINVVEVKNKKDLKSKKIGAVFVADFNNDGFDDVFLQGQRKNDAHYHIRSVSDGLLDFDNMVEFKKKDFALNWSKKKASLIVDDINNDGLLDVVRYSKSNAKEAVSYFTPATQTTGVIEQDISLNAQDNSAHSHTPTHDDSAGAVSAVAHPAGGAVTLTWHVEGNDFFEIEKRIGDAWETVYAGTGGVFVDTDVQDGIHEYRQNACVRNNAKPLCQQSVYRRVTVITPSFATQVEASPFALQEVTRDSLSPVVDVESYIPSTPAIVPIIPAGLVGDQDYTISWSPATGWHSEAIDYYYELVGEMAGAIAYHDHPTTSVVRNKPPGAYFYKVRACQIFSDEYSNFTTCSNWSATVGPWVVHGTPVRPTATYAPAHASANVPYDVTWSAGSGVIHAYKLVGEQSYIIYSGMARKSTRTKDVGTYYYKTMACNSYRCTEYTPTTSGTQVSAGNSPPDAKDDSVALAEDASVTVDVVNNDTDPNGDTLYVSAVGSASEGTTSLSGGSVTYAPHANFCGNDSFSYAVSDGNSTDSATVFVSITCVNDAPTIATIADTTIAQDTSTGNIAFTVDDIDSNVSGLTLSATSSNTALLPTNGITLSGAGTQRTVTATPNAGQHGAASVTVTVSDGNLTNSVSFTLNVNEAGGNQAPVTPRWGEKGGNVTSLGAVSVTTVGGDVHNGSVGGSAGVSGGAATYSVPVVVPPGRAGMQPSVSIHYSSRSGNGLLGVGWSLSANGAISRCPATRAQDGFTKGVAFNKTTDRLCLNGQRLMLKSGTYGNGGAEYRTEIDNFAIVKQKGAGINNNNAYFVVHYPNGRIEYYGGYKSANALHRVKPIGQRKTLIWLQSAALDASRNNMLFEYKNGDGAAEVLLDKIRYTGFNMASGNREVRFHYEARDQRTSAYIAGGKTESTQRLYAISTYYDEARVRDYRFDYQINGSAASGRDLLHEIRACTTDTTEANCTSPTTMEWHDTPMHYQVEALVTSADDALVPINTYVPNLEEHMPRGDADGNGARDWPSYYLNAEGDSEGVNPDTLQTCARSRVTLQTLCLDGDFNQDGRTDNWYRGSNQALYIAITGGSGAEQAINTGVSLDGDYTLESIADYNGDGWPDIVVYQAVCVNRTCGLGGELRLFLHSGTITDPYPDAGISIATVGESRSVNYAGDMDGDGLPDFVLSELKQGAGRTMIKTLLLTRVSESGAVSTEEIDISVEYENLNAFSMLIDVNGDGLADWLGWQGGNGDLYVRLNEGDGVFSATIKTGVALESIQTYLPNASSPSDYARTPLFFDAFKQMDINGDGRMELLLPSYDDDDIVAHFCSTFQIPTGAGPGQTESVTRCGSEIREKYFTYENDEGHFKYPESRLDANIYRYQAIRFDEDINGEMVATWVSPDETNLIAGVNNAVVVDAFGKGLSDLVFAYGCADSGCRLDSESAQLPDALRGGVNGVFFNRNYGAATQSNPGKYDYMAVDIVKHINNNQGIKSEWVLRPLSSNQYSDFYLADYNAATTTGHHLFASSMYTVAKFSQSNGVGGTNHSTYRYTNAMLNKEGRGFRGFRQIKQTDMQTGLTTTTKFKQDFPFSSAVETQTVHTDTGYLVSEITNDWRENPKYSSSNSYNIVNANAHSTQYEFITDEMYSTSYSTSQSTIDVDNDVDEFGNIKKQTNVKSVTDDDKMGVTYTTVVTRTFKNEGSFDNLWIGRVDKQTTIYSVENGDNLAVPDNNATSERSITKKFTYDTAHKKLHQQTVTPGLDATDYVECGNSSNTECTGTETTYNTYGLPLEVTTIGNVYSGSNDSKSTQSREVAFTYSDDGINESLTGYFVYNKHEYNGSTVHTTLVESNPDTGLPTKVTSSLNTVTDTTYDDFGRPTHITVTGQPAQQIDYRVPDSDTPSNNYARMMVVTSQMGAPQRVQYIDALGRVIRERVESFSGEQIFTDIEYDARGNQYRTSGPHTGSKVWTTYEYDDLGRVTKKITPTTEIEDTLETVYTHNGLTTVIEVSASDGHDLNMTRRYGVMGELLYTQDAQNGETKYAYDARGNPVAIEDAMGLTIRAHYDALGRKTQVNDPSQGLTSFLYNGFGELEREIDANNAYIRYDYDTLGRLTSRRTPQGTAMFTFDTGTGCRKGLLCKEALGGHSKAYRYDSAARVTRTTSTIDGQTYAVNTQYDANYGRVLATEYPNDLTVKYTYNDRGYLTQTSNAQSGYVYQHITEMDVWHNVKKDTLGDNTVNGTYTHSSRTGQMLSALGTAGQQTIHHLDYADYDSYGNIKTQHNRVAGINSNNSTEIFEYDSLHRLTKASLTYIGYAHSVDYKYNAVGGFLKKTDYSANNDSAYTYVANSHKLDTVTLKNNDLKSFTYDNKGNQTNTAEGGSLTYNVHNKPTYINRHGSTVNLYYGADLMRYKQTRTVSGQTTTTHYIDKLYEVEIQGSNTTQTSYLGKAIIKESGSESQIRLVLSDRLGSGTTYTDHAGTVKAWRSYDAFGRPRHGTGSDMGIKARLSENLQDSDLFSRRGFTDHEHLDEVEFIHMNGRVYDYNLGRFTSVDPFIQGHGNSQGINPYSYVMNNPLGYAYTGDDEHPYWLNVNT